MITIMIKVLIQTLKLFLQKRSHFVTKSSVAMISLTEINKMLCYDTLN